MISDHVINLQIFFLKTAKLLENLRDFLREPNKGGLGNIKTIAINAKIIVVISRLGQKLYDFTL